mmetsp:Transcript_108020/g.220537  ORF Transcript_108020/g.220537 Transcript_108020/m.220537 type:complete len:520 (+) Transcript_108020:72-1631(+)
MTAEEEQEAQEEVAAEAFDELEGADLGEEVAEEVAEEAEEEVDEEEDALLEDGLEVSEHLKDSIDGSLRLKRLLSRDDDDPDPKKRKVDTNPIKTALVKKLLTKWSMQEDQGVIHVLEQLNRPDLEAVDKANWAPDLWNQWKSPGEQLARFSAEIRERNTMPGGNVIDIVSAFKFRWKLDIGQDKLLRGLSHKDLRYVLQTYDGTTPIEEVIGQAATAEPDEESFTASASPDDPGVVTMGRFTRLELIDPLADCAVFGDANLTFAIKVAKHRKALGHVGRVIATTFEELDTLRERYKEIDESIKTLTEHYAEVYHGVDCTRIAVDPRFQGMEGSLGAVYYNFPHSGAIQGFFDGHPVVNWRHENLMRLFFRALRSFVKPGGCVKVASNAGAVGVRYSYIVGGAIENEFLHVETMPFQEWHLHRYGRSYGDKRDVYKRPDAVNNQSYNAQRADSDMVYCFCFAPTGQDIGKQEVRLPPTLKTLKACNDGPFAHIQGPAKKNLALQLHKRFVTEVSGTHVG